MAVTTDDSRCLHATTGVRARDLYHFDPEKAGKLPYLCVPLIDVQEQQPSGQRTLLGILGIDRLQGSVANPFEIGQPEDGLVEYLLRAGTLLASVVFASRQEYALRCLVDEAKHGGRRFHAEKLFNSLLHLLSESIVPSMQTAQCWAINPSSSSSSQRHHPSDAVLPPLPFLVDQWDATVVVHSSLSPVLLTSVEIQKAYLRSQEYFHAAEGIEQPSKDPAQVYTADALRLHDASASQRQHRRHETPSFEHDGMLYIRFEDDHPQEEEQRTMQRLIEVEPLAGIPDVIGNGVEAAAAAAWGHERQNSTAEEPPSLPEKATATTTTTTTAPRLSNFAKFSLVLYRAPCSRGWTKDHLHLQQLVTTSNAILRCLRARDRYYYSNSEY